jgi:hypothetical protein
MTKFQLTTKTDKLNGGTADDLFLAPLKNGHQTLTGADRLNGGGGDDAIHARLLSGALNAHLKHIETGIFTIGKVSGVGLNLAHATAMRHLALNGGSADQQAPVTVNNAGAVTRLDVTGDAGQDLTVNGLDPSTSSGFVLGLDGLLDKSEITLNSLSGNQFNNLTVNMVGASDVTFAGNCLAVTNLTVNVAGKPNLNNQNYIKFAQADADHLRHLTVAGKGDVTGYTSGVGFSSLRSFDSTAFDTGSDWFNIGGSALTSVHCGDANDHLYVSKLGGTPSHKALVTLGEGDDSVDMRNGPISGKRQHFDGGAGWDVLTFNGALENLHAVAKHFEEVDVHSATGLYNAKGMQLVNFDVLDATGAITIHGLTNGVSLNLHEDMPLGLAADVIGASTSTSESLRLLLINSMTLGSSGAGFSSAALSNLEIASFNNAHTMYLGHVGSGTDHTSVTVSSYDSNPALDGRLTLDAASGAHSYIDHFEIDNTAGVDMTGLADADIFVSTGATITGGDGDDVLVGGSGNDGISTGGGDNTVLSSGGRDMISFLASSGLDTMVFRSQSHSAYGSSVTINNFNTFDLVDISDLTGSVVFAGNYANSSTGISHLSTSQVTAFYDTGNDHLYVDLNHDGALDAAHDLDVKLDIASFNSWNITA